MAPTWVWVLVAAAGFAMLAGWRPFRRWRSSVLRRIGTPPRTARNFGVFSDVCFGSIALMWTIGGLVGLLSS